MSVLWHFYWPAIAAALVIGIIAGRLAYRRERTDDEPFEPLKQTRQGGRTLALALLVTIATALIWHGPLGAADRLAAFVQRNVRAELVHQEMTSVQARLQRQPLRRSLLLSGPADDFQRKELVRIMGEVPGVSDARWSDSPGDADAWLPLAVEAVLLSLAGFLLGLLLSYLYELRRRANAEWRW